MKKRLIIMFGAPGSGKGLLGDLIVKNNGFQKVATGDILRQEVKNKTPLGMKIADKVASGELLDDDIVNPIVQKSLQESGDIVLLDGYPRCFSQLKFLRQFAEKDYWIDCVYLNTPIDTIISRIGHRRICADCGKTHFAEEGHCPDCGGKLLVREDDANIRERIWTYLETTEPLLREELIFCCQHLMSVDGSDINKAYKAFDDAYRPF